MECFAYNQLHQIAFLSASMAPIQKYVHALQTTYHVKCRCPFLGRFYQKIFQNEALCRLVPAKGGDYTASGYIGSDQNFSECPWNIECRYSLEKPHIRISITLNRIKS